MPRQSRRWKSTSEHPFFDRSAAGLRLNAAGKSLLPYAETIAANADSAAAAVAAVTTGRLKELRVLVTPTLQPDVLAAAVRSFRIRYPEVKLIFTSGFLADCRSKILTDKIDLALAMTARYQTEELANLTAEPLFEVDQGVVAAVGHRIFAPGADIRAVFEESEWLTTVQDEKFLISHLAELGLAPPKSLTLCDFFAIDALKGRSEALSFSPLSVVEDIRYTGRVAALDSVHFPLPPLTVSFFHRKGVELSPPADYMRLAVTQAFDSWFRAPPHRWVRLPA